MLDQLGPLRFVNLDLEELRRTLELVPGDGGEDLFVGRPQHQIALAPIPQAEKDLTHVIEAAGFPPPPPVSSGFAPFASVSAITYLVSAG